jgi:2-iminobutanoate/2-iminopropanoate deaminase
MKRVLAVVSMLVAPSALPQAPATPAKPAAPVASPAPVAPFSRVVRAGDFVFVAGQLGFKQGARDLVPGGVGPETQAALEAIASNLGQAGLGMDDVVKCDVFLADIADFQAMNEAYARFFPRDPPARTTVGVAGLWGNARVEIDCIAVTR